MTTLAPSRYGLGCLTAQGEVRFKRLTCAQYKTLTHDQLGLSAIIRFGYANGILLWSDACRPETAERDAVRNWLERRDYPVKRENGLGSSPSAWLVGRNSLFPNLPPGSRLASQTHGRDPLIGKPAPADFVFHNLTEESLAAIEREGMPRDVAAPKTSATFNLHRTLSQNDSPQPTPDSHQPTLRWVKATLRQSLYAAMRPEVQAAYIVGSVARGDASPHSDLDIAVVIHPVRGKSALQFTANYHSRFPTDAAKPQWQGQRVDFQFFYPDDPALAKIHKVPLP